MTTIQAHRSASWSYFVKAQLFSLKRKRDIFCMIKNVNREEEKEKLFKNVWLLKPSDNKGHNLCKTINSIGNCKVEILQGLRPMLAQV